VEEHALRTTKSTNLLQRLHNADFVVDGHNRNQGRVRPDGGSESTHLNLSAMSSRRQRRSYNAVLLNGKVRHVKTLLLQGTARIQNTLVLLNIEK
jgi:hypothetical protein